MKPKTRQLADELVKAIRGHVEREVGSLRAEVRALEARVMMQQQMIAELEHAAEAKAAPGDRLLRAV